MSNYMQNSLIILCSDPDCAGIAGTIDDNDPTALYDKRCPECGSHDLDTMRLSDYRDRVYGVIDDDE